MGQLSLTISYKKNSGLAFSASEFVQLYFFGTPLKDGFGNTMDEDTINFYLESSQKELENMLSLKFNKTCITESRDFRYDDWIQWGYMPVSYPVVTPLSLKGFINTSLQTTYPKEWLSSKRQSPDKDTYHRNISLVPIAGAASSTTGTLQFYGISPHMGYFGSSLVPNYWEVNYITGFDTVPIDLLKALGMMAAIEIFPIIQDSLYGGAISKSIGADGLSQSSSVSQAGAYASRIKSYQTSLGDAKNPGLLRQLRMRYVGIKLGVM